MARYFGSDLPERTSYERELEEELRVMNNILVSTAPVELPDPCVQPLETAWFSSYIAYATRHGIVCDFTKPDEVFKACNEWHQEELKSRHFVYLADFRCDVCEESKDGTTCLGWFCRMRRCVCNDTNRYRWDDTDFKPNDLSSFNISHKVPFGAPSG